MKLCKVKGESKRRNHLRYSLKSLCLVDHEERVVPGLLDEGGCPVEEDGHVQCQLLEQLVR